MRWMLLVLGGCAGDKITADTYDSSPPVVWETGQWQETGSADSDSGSADDTGKIEPGSWLALRAAPDDLLVNPGASWPLRATAEDQHGAWSDVDVTWTVDDDGIVSVDAGVATAIAAGEATITATLGSLEASVRVEVTDTFQILIHPVDAATGEPLLGASAVLDDGERVKDDDGDGLVALDVPDAGRAIVTVNLRGYAPATIWGVLTRSLEVPLRPIDALESATGTISGDVDFSDIPSGDFDEIRVGIAVASVQGAPLLADVDHLVSDTRTLDLYGYTAEIPENLYLKDYAENYTVVADVGPRAIWTLAGPLPIGDLLSGLDGAGDVLALLQDNRDSLVWGWSEGGEVEAGADLSADLAPSTPLEATLLADVGELPDGFEGDEDVLLLLGQGLSDQGFVVTGFGVGTTVVDVYGAPISLVGSTGERAVALAQVGGLGSGGALCATTAEVDEGAVAMPAFPAPPSMSFAGETRVFSVSSDDRARLVHVAIVDPDGSVRDLYLDGGAVSGTLPEAGLPFGYGRTTWELTAVNADDGTFDGLVAAGALDTTSLAADASAAGRLSERF